MVRCRSTTFANSSAGACCPVRRSTTTTRRPVCSSRTSGASRMRRNTSTGKAGASKWWTSTVPASTNCWCSASACTTVAMSPERSPPRPGSVRAILRGHAQGNPEDLLRLRDLLADLDRTAFGMLLLIATLPAFIPIPVGGAISGPLALLIGVQLLAGMHKPWLPRFIADRGPHRHVLATFDRRMAPWLSRLEILVRPRMQVLVSHRLSMVVTGLLLLLLSLPIPLTNYVFGGLLLLFAVALLEGDGLVMLIAWVAGTSAVVTFGVLSGSLAAAAGQWIGRLM